MDGRSIRFRSKLLQGDVLFTASAAQSLVSFSFQIERGGLELSVGSNGLDSEQITIALPSMDSDELGFAEEQRPAGGGTVGGFHRSLISGGSNDLQSNPQNAIRILDHVLMEVLQTRSHLGGLEKNLLDPHARSLGVALENIAGSESFVRDLDFAKATAELTRAQVLFSVGASVLGSANLLPRNVLDLLP